ncbi:hypothetical protein GCM10023081_13320 [Arthrobacter ginkgonis]|uniref:Winged helix-turn helix domain-containing protein n=1 Tax=Arthrobacter ginkgonis TaxID=1630594 RepID=A0ABP7C180_9MICC
MPWPLATRAALASKGAGGARCRLDPAQLKELEKVLDAGPAASGWEADQCWTLARIAEVIHRRFGEDYTLAGACLLLHRMGWRVQVPARGPPSATRRRSPRGGTGSGPS